MIQEIRNHLELRVPAWRHEKRVDRPEVLGESEGEGD